MKYTDKLNMGLPESQDEIDIEELNRNFKVLDVESNRIEVSETKPTNPNVDVWVKPSAKPVALATQEFVNEKVNPVSEQVTALSEQIVGKKTAEGGEIFNDLENNKATGKDSHAESGNTDKEGNPGTAYTFEMASTGLTEDITVTGNEARGDNSHAEGRLNLAYGFTSHVEGDKNAAIGWRSHVEGDKNIVIGKGSHAEGGNNIVKAPRAHAEGSNNIIEENAGAAHVEGGGNIASGETSHAEGFSTVATGDTSHAEGADTTASGSISHAEGSETTASGASAHSEGQVTIASGYCSHAEGEGTTASGYCSHAEGTDTTASGYRSHAEGEGTTASGEDQHVQGKYNIPDTSDGTPEGTPNDKYIHIVGNGEYASPSNAHTLDWEGIGWYQGDVCAGGKDMDDPLAVHLKPIIAPNDPSQWTAEEKEQRYAQYNSGQKILFKIPSAVSANARVIADEYCGEILGASKIGTEYFFIYIIPDTSVTGGFYIYVNGEANHFGGEA